MPVTAGAAGPAADAHRERFSGCAADAFSLWRAIASVTILGCCP